MNAELIRMRKNKKLDIKITGGVKKISQDILSERIFSLNTNMVELFDINANPKSTISDYARNIVKSICLVLELFSEMDIYPDYFYDIYFRANEEFRDKASNGEVNGRGSLYEAPGFRANISSMMENGITNGNYRLNPNRVKNISDYYNEMVSFSRRYYLPCEVSTVEMCREMFSDIWTECNNCINYLGIRPYISDDVELLSRLLFEYVRFFAAVGINPEDYLNSEIENQSKLGKSK